MNQVTRKKASTWGSAGASDLFHSIIRSRPGHSTGAIAFMKSVKYLLVCCLLLGAESAHSEQVYFSKESFLQLAFPASEPKSGVIWLTSQRKQVAKELLGHSPSELRVRYWSLNDRSAWILDKVGKEQPITIGVIVENDEIQQVEILVYRESRGGEVRHAFFKKQFVGAQLNNNIDLDRNIDGISGATLSVNAVTMVTKWALYLHEQIF